MFLDWQQFQSTYKRDSTLYFVDPTGKTVGARSAVRRGVRPDQLATELVTKLIAGPRPEIANACATCCCRAAALRGVTRADGSRRPASAAATGGAWIELERPVDHRSAPAGNLLAAQIIWTLFRPADIKRAPTSSTPTAPPDDRFADGRKHHRRGGHRPRRRRRRLR